MFYLSIFNHQRPLQPPPIPSFPSSRTSASPFIQLPSVDKPRATFDSSKVQVEDIVIFMIQNNKLMKPNAFSLIIKFLAGCENKKL